LTALLDVNVLLSLAFTNHPHHQAAETWFVGNASAGWATCLLTEMGFLRLSLNPVIVGVSLDSRAALTLLSGLVADPHHQFFEPAPTARAAPFDQLLPKIVGHQQISDAGLLHLARFHNAKLVTFDQAISALCPWTANLEIIVP
jgi:toxin-antitoxin system PIN domain toxin